MFNLGLVHLKREVGTIACGKCHKWDLHFHKREKYVNDEDFIVIK
jgi:hypothetical protein